MAICILVTPRSLIPEAGVEAFAVSRRRGIVAVYVISGLLSAIAGVISASRTAVGSAQTGVSAELNVIAAVVIGEARASDRQLESRRIPKGVDL